MSIQLCCEKCGGGRRDTRTENDEFVWQCPKCNTRQTHSSVNEYEVPEYIPEDDVSEYIPEGDENVEEDDTKDFNLFKEEEDN